jgi:hypothetical protein
MHVAFLVAARALPQPTVSVTGNRAWLLYICGRKQEIEMFEIYSRTSFGSALQWVGEAA